jgi:nucleoside-diphosphate-sugar epimerase
MESVFVTGGSGFVGGAVIRELAARGIPARGLARSARAADAIRQAGGDPVRGDLADEAAMCAGMLGSDVVVHCAAKVLDWGRREDFAAVNIEGTRNALRAAREAGVKRFVHVGTEAVLAGGFPIVRADETTPYPAMPNGLYPWSKGQAERDVLAANGGGFTTVSARPRFIWGRGDPTLLPQIARAMQSGAWAWFGGGHHASSTCHVRNVVEGVLLAAQHGAGGESYFLTDGPPLEFRDFVTRLAATQGVVAPAREMPLWLVNALAAGGEFVWKNLNLPGRPLLTRTAVNLMFMEVTVNDAKARRDLGYTSHVSVEQGLAELRADHEAGVNPEASAGHEASGA